VGQWIDREGVVTASDARVDGDGRGYPALTEKFIVCLLVSLAKK